MKARMEVTLDTIWTNQVTASVECELDNPHVLSAQMLAEMMTHRLKYLVAEIRHANDRAAFELKAEDAAEGTPRAQVDASTGTPERERQAYEDMQRDKGAIDVPLREPQT